MRLVIQIMLVISVWGCHQNKLKQITEDELIMRITEHKMPKAEDVKIRNLNGEEISVDSLKILELKGNYFEDFYINDKGKIVQIIVRLKTPNDDKLMAKINQKIEAVPDLIPVNIVCKYKANILQRVFDRDQNMRQGDNEIDPNIDHENLEIIVSLLEKCGMPTLDEVNDVQMAGIWLVLQHAPAKYQSKYIPMLEHSAEKGDIKWGAIALMKDRALMYEGKPQIYGSQVSNGELYNLFEPEYVNQRRKEIELEPLEEYLQRFGIDFKIDQKTK